GRRDRYADGVRRLVELYQRGVPIQDLRNAALDASSDESASQRVFPNVDGIKFLTHTGGCGGTREDAAALCELLAAYIDHPNVAGATVLSLGCQNAQLSMLEDAVARRRQGHQKPLIQLEQQRSGTEKSLMDEAIRGTFAGLAEANDVMRAPAPMSHLVFGVECGGSDGFSGITANPAIGRAADLCVALGGTVLLSEFPELCGVEQELIDRSVSVDVAARFAELQRTYAARAEAVGSSFDMNPSPGNIRDGLITDAMKSAGAARKGGTSPVVDVLDYTQTARRPGLNLVCTPGNDVESTTALAAAGANVVLFSTGLGTPTGNPIVPVIKISTNTPLARRMPDVIDLDAGGMIEGEETLEEVGARILDLAIEVASGRVEPAAVRLGQDDFIPWKRGISL
ncbi:MAG TPA: UxaA family hydrolase, partial [Rhodothermales bacterium]